MENQSEMTRNNGNLTDDEAWKQLYVVKPFFLPDLDDDILILPGSSVEIMDDSKEYTDLLVRITGTDGSELCRECWGYMFWLKKENQTQEYWDENHEDDEDFVSIDRELLDGHTLELTAEQMQNELSENPINAEALIAEHERKKHLEYIEASIRKEDEEIDKMSIEECIASLSKPPVSRETARQELKDEMREYDAKLRAMTLHEIIAGLGAP